MDSELHPWGDITLVVGGTPELRDTVHYSLACNSYYPMAVAPHELLDLPEATQRRIGRVVLLDDMSGKGLRGIDQAYYADPRAQLAWLRETGLMPADAPIYGPLQEDDADGSRLALGLYIGLRVEQMRRIGIILRLLTYNPEQTVFDALKEGFRP